jgi:hypothetical protein
MLLTLGTKELPEGQEGKLEGSQDKNLKYQCEITVFSIQTVPNLWFFSLIVQK